MWSEFALQKAKGQTSLEEDQYDTFKNDLTSTTYFPFSACVFR